LCQGGDSAYWKVPLPLIQPIIPTRIRAPFDHPDFLFELKHDGFRALAYIADGTCRFVSRKQNVFKRFDRLGVAIARRFGGIEAILDGEIVCLDDEGRSVFMDLLRRPSQRAPVFFAFDLLWLGGEDLRSRPLIDRKDRLKELLVLHGEPRSLFAHHVVRQGVKLYEAIRERDCEGIVAKPKDSTYFPSAKWLKILNTSYTQKEGRRELFEKFHARP
jgi:bifunctional non-homologous end joining protein LigD